MAKKPEVAVASVAPKKSGSRVKNVLSILGVVFGFCVLCTGVVALYNATPQGRAAIVTRTAQALAAEVEVPTVAVNSLAESEERDPTNTPRPRATSTGRVASTTSDDATEEPAATEAPTEEATATIEPTVEVPPTEVPAPVPTDTSAPLPTATSVPPTAAPEPTQPPLPTDVPAPPPTAEPIPTDVPPPTEAPVPTDVPAPPPPPPSGGAGFECNENGCLTPPDPNCPIKGNISTSSGDKIYHIPGWNNYDETRIDIADGERWFCTEQEALNAGWRAPLNH